MAQFPSSSESVTVILATHNGGERLRRTLESMTRLQSPPGGWNAIIIDNASTDETSSLIQRFTSFLPLKVLVNPILGKNRSLNIAIPLVKSELIIFTDDDVIFPDNWLISYFNLADVQRNFSVFGGRIVPDWPNDPDIAILEGIPLGNAFAVHEDNIPDGEVNPGKIWGPNMAVRTELFREGNNFNEEIGPLGKNYVPGSESVFNLQLERKGHRFWFSNGIVVKHQIRPEQLTKEWLRSRAFRLGRGQVRWGALDWRRPRSLPRWYVRYLIENWVRLLWARCRSRSTEEMRAMWHYNVAKGMIFEHRKLNISLSKNHLSQGSLSHGTSLTHSPGTE